MASIAVPADLVNAIASEMAIGVERAVECWMSQIEAALTDTHLTSLDAFLRSAKFWIDINT